MLQIRAAILTARIGKRSGLLRAELEGLKLSQLRRRALDAGVAAGALDAAEDDESDFEGGEDDDDDLSGNL
mgnify:CR=1 FL=1